MWNEKIAKSYFLGGFMLFLSACKGHNHSKGVGVCERCGEMQNPELVSFIDSTLKKATETGNKMIGQLSGINGLSTEKQYDAYCKAYELASEMDGYYAEISDCCKNAEDLSGMVYQISLLENIMPPKIENNNPASIEFQRQSYQLYLQQLSSSSHYFGDYLRYLSGDGAKPLDVEYFEEQPDIPRPNRCIYSVKLVSKDMLQGNVQYIFLIGAEKDDADLNYNIYLAAIGINKDLDVSITDEIVYVKKDSEFISAMSAYEEPGVGCCLKISFRA